MKPILPAIVLLLTMNVSAQKYLVIDSSKKTEAIFDQSNPQSYMSILLWNRKYIGYLFPVYMQPLDLQKMSKDQRSQLIRFIGQPGTVPLIDSDPESENFGNHLIVESEEGMQSFVYEAPDTMYTDLKGVSRIVLEYRAGESPLIDRVTQVTFCKKYNEKYIPVLRFFDNAILRMDGFQCFSEVETEKLLRGTETPGVGYWEQLEDSARSHTENYCNNLDYFPSAGIFSRRNCYDYVPQYFRDMNEMIYPYQCDFNDSDRFPFDYWYAESLGENQGFLDVVFEDFDSVTYSIYQDDLPVVDFDPNSPNFGEYAMTEDSLGNISFVYPDPEVIFEWVDFTPYKSYAVRSMVSDGNKMKFVLEKMIFTVKKGDREQLVVVHDPTEYWRDLLGKDLILEKDGEDWYKTYLSAFRNGKTYSRDSEKDRKAMNVSETFWYR